MSAPIAVAVVSWNTRELLAECLRSLEPDVRASRAEVWVVDNASSDGSAAMVTESFPWVSLVASEENLGFGRAVNLVAERTASAWIAPANADVALTPGALERLLAAGGRHPESAVLAPRLLRPDGATEQSVHSFPTLPFTAMFNLGLLQRSHRLADRACLEGDWDADRPREVPWAVGALVLVRREAFDAVGGFDARQWMYAEDLDLQWRLSKLGQTTRYVPDAAVHHAGGAAASQAFGPKQTARWLEASYTWMLRRRGRAITVAFGVLSLGGLAWRLVLASQTPAGSGGSRAERRRYWRRWVGLHLRAFRAATRRHIPAGR